MSKQKGKSTTVWIASIAVCAILGIVLGVMQATDRTQKQAAEHSKNQAGVWTHEFAR